MGVYYVDRASGDHVGVPRIVHDHIGQALRALDVPMRWELDGYTPMRVAQAAGKLLVKEGENLVVVCRPEPWKGPGLHPIEIHRKEDQEQHMRKGELLGFFEVSLSIPMLRWAHFASSSSGYTVTTLRPPSDATGRSNTAMRSVLRGSGMLR